VQATNGITRLHEKLSYVYDKSGNLSYRTNNDLVQTFSANTVNELSTVSRNTNMTVAGTTTSAAGSVTVNGISAIRYTNDNTFARTNVGLVDGTNTFTAVAGDSLGRDSSDTSTLYLPASASFVYDSNGNLVYDGNRAFGYDDESQITSVLVTNSWKSEFTYDGKGRRRIRKEYKWSNSAWLQTTEIHYVYSGMLVIQERNANNLPLVTYTRGLDLSGTSQGAGGIGGLLARTDHTSGQTAYYHADGNGNITMLVNAQQLPVAKYLYDSFGNTIATSGPLADGNLYRFSSKEQHTCGPYYFGRRFYDPVLQRWLGPDPIQEARAVNLFGFVGNNALTRFDPFGLREVTVTIYYNFEHFELTDRIRSEVNRVAQDALMRYGKRKAEGCPEQENTIKLRWVLASSEPRDRLGFQGGFFHFNPTGYGVYVDDSFTWPGKLGSTGTDEISINYKEIKGFYNDFDDGAAAVISHETFHHAIGGAIGGHAGDKGYIDSVESKEGGVLSDPAAKKLIDKLDLD